MKAIPILSRSIRPRPVFWLPAVLSLLLVACAQAPSPTPAPPPTKAPTPQTPAATAAPKPATAATQPAAKPTAAPTQPAAVKPAEAGTKPSGSAAKPAAQPKALQKVRLNVTGTISEAPHYIAMEKGWMKEGGIEVDIASLASAADVMPALSAGQLDVVAGGINIGTFNAVARGVPLTVVANQAYLTPGNDGNVLLVRTDLANEIKTVRDLKGRKVAINSPTSPIVYMLGKMLEKNGMKLSDVEVVTIGFPDMITALANKAIDAAVEVEPFAARAEDMGVGKELAVVSQVIGPMEVGVVFFNTDWAKKNPDLANNYVTAFLRGSRQYYEAMKRGPNRAEVVGILTKYTPIKDAPLYEKVRWTGLNPDGYMDTASIQDQIDWYFNNKLIDQKVPVDKVINHSYLDEAIKRVGKYNR